ncbi:restriction endonuclease subunit S [Streptomyces olivaceus]
MISKERRLKYLYRVIDQRAGANPPPLLAVSIHHGVVPRSTLTDDLPRAEDLSNYKMCNKGDIVLNRMRAFQGAIGISPASGIVSPDYMVLRPWHTTDARYLHHLFRSEWFVGEMSARLRGIGGTESGSVRTPRINPEDLGDIRVTLPSLDEQHRIADFLDTETARVNDLVALRRKQDAALEERYNAVISDLTTPGIGKAGARNHTWPWLPRELDVARLGYLARVQSGVTVHGARDRDPEDSEYPYLRVANVQGERVDLTEVKTITIPKPMAMRSTLRAGDVVMTEANGNPDNLGRGAVWQGEIANMVHQNHVFAVRVDPNKLIPEYLSSLLAASHGRRYFRFTSSQVGIATTSSSKVLDFPIPVRNIAEQRQVVREYAALRESIERVRNSLSRQLNLLSERRQALITAAVTGQFDVSTASGRNVTEGVTV